MRAALGVIRTPAGAIGVALVAFVVVVALLGPAVAPHSPTEVVGALGVSADGAPLGVDSLGRDILSRLLNGGRSLLLLALVATALAYLVGAAIGMVAGYVGRRTDSVLMRIVDVLLSFPPLLLVLILLAGVGSGTVPLVVGVAFVQIPGIARLVRTATLETATRGYVEAAVLRGESTAAVIRREVLPNILAPVIADAGLRFTFSVLIIAAVNFLGLGLQPPSSDWGVMIAENRNVISSNSMAVLAPTVMLAILTIGVNLTGDAVARCLGRSDSQLVP